MTTPQLSKCESLPAATAPGELTPGSPPLARDGITALTDRRRASLTQPERQRQCHQQAPAAGTKRRSVRVSLAQEANRSLVYCTCFRCFRELSIGAFVSKWWGAETQNMLLTEKKKELLHSKSQSSALLSSCHSEEGSALPEDVCAERPEAAHSSAGQAREELCSAACTVRTTAAATQHTPPRRWERVSGFSTQTDKHISQFPSGSVSLGHTGSWLKCKGQANTKRGKSTKRPPQSRHPSPPAITQQAILTNQRQVTAV